MKKLLIILAFCLCANADVFQNQQVYAAANVVNSFGCEANKTLSEKYIKNAKAVVILTDVTKTGFIASIQSGNGVFSMKTENGDWTPPIMVRYRGIGAGLQAGHQSTDIVMLFQTSKSFRDLFVGQDTLEIGAGASFFEGKSAGVVTDIPEVSAWMVKPGEVTGIYLGASIDFGRITIDNQATNDYYDRMYDYEDILNGSPRDSKYTKILKYSLSKNLGKERTYGTCNAAK